MVIAYGEIYNTNLIIDNNGILIGKHRKLVPTWAEKLTWTSGDGSSLKVYNTEIGPIGTLACGENTNTLARFTLLVSRGINSYCELHFITSCATRL